MSDTGSDTSTDDKSGEPAGEDGSQRIAEIVAAAEGVLRERWGGPVRLGKCGTYCASGIGTVCCD